MPSEQNPLENNDINPLDNDNAENQQAEKEAFPEDNSADYVSFTDEMAGDLGGAQEQPVPNDEDQLRIQVLEEQLERTKDQMIRALAEAENARKRAQKEREDASKFAVSKFSRDVLSVADNLRRALDSVQADMVEALPQIKNLIDGIEATERELLRVFEMNGIKKTNPIDELFDPNFHEVMFEAPMPDKENGTIIQVIEPGYILNGRILRPARVGIAKSEISAQQSPGHTINTEV